MKKLHLYIGISLFLATLLYACTSSGSSTSRAIVTVSSSMTYATQLLKSPVPSSMVISTATPSPTVKPTITPVVEGKVLEIGKNIFVIRNIENSTTVLQMSDQSTVWDGITWVAEIPVRKGDFAIASGEWDQDRNIFLVQNLYINIYNIKGIVQSVDVKSTKFTIGDLQLGNRTISVAPHSQILENGNVGPNQYQDVKVLPILGSYVEIIGREVDDGIIVAVYIYIQ